MSPGLNGSGTLVSGEHRPATVQIGWRRRFVYLFTRPGGGGGVGRTRQEAPVSMSFLSMFS